MQTSRHLHYLHPNLSGKNTNEHTFARVLINPLDCLHAFEYHKYLCYFKFQLRRTPPYYYIPVTSSSK